jgi:hypothetical protein
MELFEKVQRFAYRIGYTILPAEVLDTSLDVTNMPCEDLNGNTVIDLLF